VPRDQFVLQEDGLGRIVGRVKDMIIRAGDKIFPTEVEEFFTGHPDILEAQVKFVCLLSLLYIITNGFRNHYCTKCT
jgi:acyl-coenzyme A synthetase/AMP-(fatty) acid ligase